MRVEEGCRLDRLSIYIAGQPEGRFSGTENMCVMWGITLSEVRNMNSPQKPAATYDESGGSILETMLERRAIFVCTPLRPRLVHYASEVGQCCAIRPAPDVPFFSVLFVARSSKSSNGLNTRTTAMTERYKLNGLCNSRQ